MRSLKYLLSLCGLWGVFAGASLLYADAAPKDEGVDALRAFESTVREAVQHTQKATVGVAGGSGVIISPDGILLTVAHVASQSGKHLPIVLPDGRKTRAVVLGTHQSYDAAVCKIIDPGPWPFAELGDSEQLNRGDWVIVLGYPMSFEKGQPPAVRVGRVSRRSDREITADCPIMGGDSGGPLIDLAGRVIGIGTRCDDDRPAINFFVAENVYRTSWERMLAGENIVTSRPRNGGIKRPQRPDWAEGFAPLPNLIANYPPSESNTKKTSTNSNTSVVVKKIPSAFVSNDSIIGRRQALEQAIGIENPLSRWPNREQIAVDLFVGHQRIAAGCLWGRANWVVTKASLIDVWSKDALRCQLHDGSERAVRWLGVSSNDDLALLELLPESSELPLNDAEAASLRAIPASVDRDLDFVPLESSSITDVGSVVVSMKGNQGHDVGFMLTKPRRFTIRPTNPEKPRAKLGVRTRSTEEGLYVFEVYPDSAAALSGLCVGDVLTRINGEALVEPKDLIDRVQSSMPGTRLELALQRDSEPLTLRPMLGMSDIEAPKTPFDNWGGGPFSLRRFGFGTVWVHDTALDPEDCGGPLLDVQGNLIGINISRATRVATYALPASRVNEAIREIVSRN